MKQNKLLYNIVKIAANEAAADTTWYNYYEDLPVAVRMEMARKIGEQHGKSRLQDNLRGERLAQYVRDYKMSPQEAAKRFQAAQKHNYTPDLNYHSAMDNYPKLRDQGMKNYMSAYEKNKEKKLKMKALGK